MRVVIVHSLQCGLEIEVAEIVDSRVACPGRTVPESAVADPMGSAGSWSLAVAGRIPESLAVRMGYRYLKSRFAARMPLRRKLVGFE